MEQVLSPRAISLEWRLRRAEDAELVAGCVRGSSAAYQELLSRYRRPTVSLAYQMLGDAEEAEDVAQEAFVRVFQSMPRFRRQAAFSTWLYRIVTNLCLGRLRKARPTVELDSLGEPPSGDDPERHVTEALATRQALARMEPALRAILLLRDQEGLSYREIAATLSLPMGTVRSRLSKARALFRQLWTEFA